MSREWEGYWPIGKFSLRREGHDPTYTSKAKGCKCNAKQLWAVAWTWWWLCMLNLPLLWMPCPHPHANAWYLSSQYSCAHNPWVLLYHYQALTISTRSIQEFSHNSATVVTGAMQWNCQMNCCIVYSLGRHFFFLSIYII